MKPHCYDVLQQGGKWVVRQAHRDASEEYLNLGLARDAALTQARTRWKIYGCPSTVRVQVARGEWTTIEDLGKETPNASGAFLELD